MQTGMIGYRCQLAIANRKSHLPVWQDFSFRLLVCGNEPLIWACRPPIRRVSEHAAVKEMASQIIGVVWERCRIPPPLPGAAPDFSGGRAEFLRKFSGKSSHGAILRFPERKPQNRAVRNCSVFKLEWSYSSTSILAMTAAQRGQRPSALAFTECIQQRGHLVPLASDTPTVS